MSDPADDMAVPPVGRTRPKKAPNAFRTISEVADDLHIPQHVLRFWETKFPQVKPLKRGGGRRYYRPDDIALLRRISDLLVHSGLYDQGRAAPAARGRRQAVRRHPAGAARTNRRQPKRNAPLPCGGAGTADAGVGIHRPGAGRSRQRTPQGRSGSRAPARVADGDAARTGRVAGPVLRTTARPPPAQHGHAVEVFRPVPHPHRLGNARYTRAAGTKSRYAEACVELPPPRPRVLAANRA